MRKSRAVEVDPWRFIAFADLHVGAKTIGRALRALRGIREHAVREGARVVFTGDFWDTRGVLDVRQVDALMEEFGVWLRDRVELILIPGNHDQVTMDGQVHGARIFEPFANITVATERLLWPESRIAFIPWREAAEAQAALFDLDGSGWTIFAHAEVTGAKTNHGYEAPGRVSLGQIEAQSRACYLGHYHKRQQLGEHTWYLGNPFELNFGEMGNETGCALIKEGVAEPVWLELEGMPRHHRAVFPTPVEGTINQHDIVEVYAEPELIGSEVFEAFCKAHPVVDLRRRVTKPEEADPSEPAFALTLDQAIEEITDDEDLRALGRSILSELPDARALAPASPKTTILDVTARDFCALQGEVRLDLEKRGQLLIRGEVGAGKTALLDAISWCLYGATSPRKAGSDAATFRGDEVVHDDAKSCAVSVRVRLDGFDDVITITRTKKRGSGAKVGIKGWFDAATGISDSGRLIEHIVGINYALWRASVSLGQGATANFVTDADKRRKELLSEPFGLSVCPPAQKAVRHLLKPLAARQETLSVRVATQQQHTKTLKESDFREQITAWEEQQAATSRAAVDRGGLAKAALEEVRAQLAGEEAWVERRQQHQQVIESLTQELGGMTVGDDVTAVERRLGALEAERSQVERSLSLATPELSRLEVDLAKTKQLPCPTCGQALPAGEGERVVAAKRNECERLERSVRSFGAQIANLTNEVSNLRRGDTSRRDALNESIAESRVALVKIGEALSAFTRLRANQENAERQLEEARALWKKSSDAVNPFLAKQEEIAARVQESEAALASLADELFEVQEQRTRLSFWEDGFGPRGIPALVLRTVTHELETYANNFLGELLLGQIWVKLGMEDDALKVHIFESKNGEVYERRYEQLSGGQRRCIELSFAPLALSEMVFNRCGTRIPLLLVDELTTHLGQAEKKRACDLLKRLDRDTVVVVDHDGGVQGQFDEVLDLELTAEGTVLRRIA